MGLNDATARLAARHAHALVVGIPGSWRTRVAGERAVLDRGWQLATSPADADVLVVCGEPGPRLAEAVDLVWEQMPGPRVRVDVRAYDDVAARLEEAHAGLLDTGHHRHDAVHRAAAADLLTTQADRDGTHQEGHGGHDGHEQMDHSHDGEHGGHGDMEMSPGGIPLAGGGEDRDGLEMDVLQVRLGPVLPHWPAGLVLYTSLQGDVITSAHAELLDASIHDADEPGGPARGFDNVASLLALAGWDHGAAEAHRVRDAALEADTGPAGPGLERLRRRVSRSRTLRWSLRGVRPLTEQDVDRHGLPAGTVGDTHDRLLRMLGRASDGEAGPAFSTEQLAHLATGLDLATARLVVASLDVQQLTAGHDGHEARHG